MMMITKNNNKVLCHTLLIESVNLFVTYDEKLLYRMQNLMNENNKIINDEIVVYNERF